MCACAYVSKCMWMPTYHFVEVHACECKCRLNELIVKVFKCVCACEFWFVDVCICICVSKWLWRCVYESVLTCVSIYQTKLYLWSTFHTWATKELYRKKKKVFQTENKKLNRLLNQINTDKSHHVVVLHGPMSQQPYHLFCSKSEWIVSSFSSLVCFSALISADGCLTFWFMPLQPAVWPDQWGPVYGNLVIMLSGSVDQSRGGMRSEAAGVTGHICVPSSGWQLHILWIVAPRRASEGRRFLWKSSDWNLKPQSAADRHWQMLMH